MSAFKKSSNRHFLVKRSPTQTHFLLGIYLLNTYALDKTAEPIFYYNLGHEIGINIGYILDNECMEWSLEFRLFPKNKWPVGTRHFE